MCINSFAHSKFDENCRNISGTIKHSLDIQVKRLRKIKKKQYNFQAIKKSGQGKNTGIHNFTDLPETWQTQKNCWHTFVCCVCNLSQPEPLSKPHFLIALCSTHST